MSKAPNLLFLFSDQHTAKVAGCYGDPLVQTPNIDRLAARGVTFDNAYCPAPICVPSRMAMLTGRWPKNQQVWINSDMLASDLPTMAHSLAISGRQPTLIGRMHTLGPDQLRGYTQRLVGDHSSNWPGIGSNHDMGPLGNAHLPNRDSLTNAGCGQSSYEAHDVDVVEAACAHFDALGERRRSGDMTPFAATVGFMLPHNPYVARPEDYQLYEGRIGLPGIPAAPAEDEHPYIAGWRDHAGCREVDEASVLRARTAYYGLVTRLDTMLGQVLDALERNGLADDTLIVYASDHGDLIGEHGLWWKMSFYEDSVKVPMVLSWPGRLPEGERRSQIVNLIDLTATMLDAMDAPPLPHADGRSFLDVARDGTAPWIDETFSEYCTDGFAVRLGENPFQQRMVRSGRWKLVYYHGHPPQLFDLETDPQERRDLANEPTYAAVRDALTARVLADWDPNEIAERMAARRRDKTFLATWARVANPPDTCRWTMTKEQNWLA